MEPWATSETIGGKHVLRFVRRLAHPPEKVFRAISDPDELRHWFPVDAGGDRRVVEEDPPRLLVMRWEEDELRFEIVPEPGGGCRLHFTHLLAPDGSSGGRPGLARNAAGWDTCLAALDAHLQGAPAPELSWFALFEGYAERFGLVEGEVDGDGAVRFARDVVATPEQVWALLTEDRSVAVGQPAPRRFAPAPPGTVTAVEPERAVTLETDAGPVRWTLDERRPGALIGVRQEVADPSALPAALAAWQVHLELLVAALQGIERCWPEERVAALEARYAARLAAPVRPAARR